VIALDWLVIVSHAPQPTPARDLIQAFARTRLIVDANLVRQLIEAGMPGARVVVQGEDGVHFEAEVVSDAFRGKLPLARHRMVYATLGERMGSEIHALSLRTLTPDEAR
jgi:acid stress-induced BolA-like protein IbaG/YrbA